VRGQQLVQRPVSDLRGDRDRVGGERVDQCIRHGTMRPAAFVEPADDEPGPLQPREHLLERREPDRVGVGHARSLPVRERQALFQREGEAPADRERIGYLPHQGFLVGKGEHGLEQEHHVERAARDRGDPRDLEATGKVTGALACDSDGAGAQIHPQIGATQFPRDEPAGPGNPATQVQHGDPACDAGPTRKVHDLAGAHQALLLDELARGVRRHPGSLQRLDERRALVLLHG
jgi:hypothetical protein